MASPYARPLSWPAVVRFHRECMRQAGETSFALPVTASAAAHWSPLAGFEPAQLAGPWEVGVQALASTHLKDKIQAGLGQAFIGGPCWFRPASADENDRSLEWIPLIYREVTVEHKDDRLQITPAQDGWEICPLVSRLLEERNALTFAPLDETLPALLSRAESKAIENGHDLSRTLTEAFEIVAPELGEVLEAARGDLPAVEVDYTLSPWVLFTAASSCSAATEHVLPDYGRLQRNLAASPQDVGGLRLLQHASGPSVLNAPDLVPIVPLDDVQRSAVESTLAGRPVTVINGSPDGGKTEVILSILFNAWASSTKVLFASDDERTVDVVCQRLKSLESDLEIAVHADEQSNDVDEALGHTIDLLSAHRGESHYGGSPVDRKRMQLNKKKQQLRDMLTSQVPQRLSGAIESALEAHAAHHEALSTLQSRREELAERLRGLGIEDDPDTLGERILEPLRKWRDGIGATRRLIEEDAQRVASLEKELASARAERDAALTAAQIEAQSDDSLSWLLDEPGFRAFDQALSALADKIKQAVEDDRAEAEWDKAYEAWPSSQVAADWERRARETASLMRAAGVALVEQTEEVRAAREALDAAKATVQKATKTASIDVRREDVDAWAECYAELMALPKPKHSFLPQPRRTEAVRRIEEVERRLRYTLPVHIWSTIGELNDNGRARLAPVVERVREWAAARDDWDNLGAMREEIEAQTEALRQRVTALGARSLATEVTPATCAGIATRLIAKASVAAAAAAAWARRERRERLPKELAELAGQIRAAGAGTPFKEAWMKGAGAPLVAALDAVAADPRIEKAREVRREILSAATADSMVKHWWRAYEAEARRAAIAEELERIPSRDVRLAHWKSRRPAGLPATLDVADAFDGDDAHPLWTFLRECEEWSRAWTAFCDEDAPALQRTANEKGESSLKHLREAARILPESKERTWLESLASGPAASEPWPAEKLTGLAALWRAERLQAGIKGIDAQLERIRFESAREQWLDRVTRDAAVVTTLNALRRHYKDHHQHIEEDGYAHFEQALKAQPVWITPATAPESIPMRPGLFDVVVIDDATKCKLTDVLPLIFRAKRLVVIGDSTELPALETPCEAEKPALAAKYGIEEWTEFLGHAGNNAYKAAVGVLPRGEADVISLTNAES